jgi:Amt family ammonium transporter
VGGILGAVATGIFATKAVNPLGQDGLLAGNPGLLVNQLIAVVAVVAYAALITFVLLKVIDRVIGIRVSADEEAQGLDATQHGETAYTS